jgi:hypothetical protein
MVEKNKKFGQYFTPEEIFSEFIFPEIETKLYDYKFVDLFAGEGNLILPILNHIPENKRIEYFKKHIFLFDIQNELTEKAIQKEENYGIPKKTASQNIKNIDTLKNYPNLLLNDNLPIYQHHKPTLPIHRIYKKTQGNTALLRIFSRRQCRLSRSISNSTN